MKKFGIFLIFSFLIIFSLQQIVFAETEEKEERTKKKTIIIIIGDITFPKISVLRVT